MCPIPGGKGAGGRSGDRASSRTEAKGEQLHSLWEFVCARAGEAPGEGKGSKEGAERAGDSGRKGTVVSSGRSQLAAPSLPQGREGHGDLSTSKLWRRRRRKDHAHVLEHEKEEVEGFTGPAQGQNKQ